MPATYRVKNWLALPGCYGNRDTRLAVIVHNQENEYMAVLRGRLTPQNYRSYGAARIVAAGILFSFSALIIYNAYFGASSKQPRTQATVIRSEKHVLGEGTSSEQTIYTPVLQYAVGGKTYTTNQGVQAVSQPYTAGQTVEIQYDPMNPSQIYQPQKSRNATLFVLATAITIPAVALLIRTLRQIVAMRRSERG
jgi:hypothetical protein